MKNSWKKEDRPYNLEDISESDVSKYKKLKEGDDIKVGDYIHIFDESYAEIGKGCLLTKQKVNKTGVILRKK